MTEGSPPEARIVAQFEAAGGSPPGRDMRPAVGTRGQPGTWRRAVPGAAVALARRAFEDARWSYLYKRDTRYRRWDGRPVDGSLAAAARRARGGDELPVSVHGPVINAPVWTWEVPVYFWLGGMAAGASFAAVGADVVGDDGNARIMRRVALGAVLPGGPLLIADLGRPERFLHMMRIFKTRSPMSMGAWCLAAFSTTAGTAVAADLVGRDRAARVLGGATAAFGLYLGSYTGALLASTAVPVWGRSRAYLGPIFVCTAVATGAAASRLTLAATGTRAGHPTRRALAMVETSAMAAELVLSTVNERRLGRLADALEQGMPGRLQRAAKGAVAAGLALRLARRRGADHASSALFVAAALAFRLSWVGAGRASARDDEAVALAARRS
jgi:hypothetical protein